ncbi:MAG: hypothetical protein J0L61_08595 [Planctomycetes bacterium]|nr:hypothetical protein [Planctomycetota bacterium]
MNPRMFQQADAAPAANATPKASGGFATLADVGAAAVSSPASLPKPRKLGGMTVLVVVVLVGAAMLFGMRKLGTVKRIQMVDFKIDYPLEKAERERLSKDHEEILRDLQTSGNVVQVPLEQVQANPFEWKLTERKVERATDDAALAAERSRKEIEARKREIESKAGLLKLNSVLAGAVPCAKISGALVRVGDTVDETFTVDKIEGRTVTLSAEGMTFTLTLGEPR